MKVLVAANRSDETEIFEKVNRRFGFELTFMQEQLTEDHLDQAAGFDALCINAGCRITRQAAYQLRQMGVRYILTRAAGKDHLDISAIKEFGLKSANVPAYSPNAISEHTLLLILAMLRKLKKQLKTIEDQYFFITGLRGRELRSMTVGVLGTGRIGSKTVQNLSGFGCRILACDLYENPEVTPYADYVTREELLSESDIVVLHCPMLEENYHLINTSAIAAMKDGAMLVNTARGAIVDSQAVYEALKSGKLSAFAMDVYEFEDKTQRRDYRQKELDDELLRGLLTMDQVIYTSHTAFYTEEAIENIIETSLSNLYEWITDGVCKNETEG
ncbi:MAG: NAD(P)-dependent oxidoreductase [Lachnospiraceae bacterium]